MKFVYGSKVIIAFMAFMVVASFNVEKTSAVELFNEDGLLAVLKKNSVLSERDIDAIKNEYPKMEIKGSLQLQYVNADAEPGSKKINEIDLRRANLTVVGRVTDKVSLVLEPEYGKGLPSIRDAYIAYRPSSFGIFAGNHRVPFSAEALNNDINLRFAERNLTSQISPDRMVGVSFLKTMRNNKLTAQVGIWNSNINTKAEADLINNRIADNQIFATNSTGTGSNIFIKAVRIGYSSKGRDDFYTRGNGFDEDENFNREKSVGWGVSYYTSEAATTNSSTTGTTGLNGANAYEADLLFRVGRLTGEIEYASRNLDWWQYNAAQTISVPVASVQTSYSAQASLLLTGKVSLAMRQESFEYDGKGKVLKGIYGQDQDSWLTAGLNYYSKEQNTKIQLNYILKNEVMPSGGKAPSNNTAFIQATTYF